MPDQETITVTKTATPRVLDADGNIVQGPPEDHPKLVVENSTGQTLDGPVSLPPGRWAVDERGYHGEDGTHIPHPEGGYGE